MTKKRNRKIFTIVFYFVVLGLTLWYVFQDENLSQVMQYLSEAKNSWVGAGVVAVVKTAAA